MQRHERLTHELLASACDAPEVAAAVGEVAERGAPTISELDATLCRVHDVMHTAFQPSCALECRCKDVRGIQRSARPGQDERHAALVDQHAVGFVDDAELESREQRGRAACETIEPAT